MTNMGTLKWVGAVALVLAVTWGPGPAQAADASGGYTAETTSRPNIAPVAPAIDYNQYLDLKSKLIERATLPGGGVIGTGERLRDHGSSLRKDLIRKRTVKEVIDRSHGGGNGGTSSGTTRGGGNGGGTESVQDGGDKPPLVTGEPLFDTQPIGVDYQPVSEPQPPTCPEPASFALVGMGIAGLAVTRRRKMG